MRYITRVHLSDCGWQEAYFPGTTIELADPRTGKPRHTVFSLENTGGKTSFLALVLSCFDTNERRFLKTLIRSNQRFGDYFGEVPGFILVEWDISGGQTSLLDPERLITGQVVVPRGEGRQREFDRRFFTFRSTPGLAFDDIPAPGLPGFKEHERLRGHQDVQRWLHALRTSHPGNFQDFMRQSDWKRKLAEEKIDTELLAAQVDFNRDEGGIEDFLNFRSESEFVRKFLTMTLPAAEADAVRGVLAEHVGRLSDLPRLQRRRDAMHRLKEQFAPFVVVAEEAKAAQRDVWRSGCHAFGLKVALDERRRRAMRQAELHCEAAGAHENAAKEAEVACKSAQVELASVRVELVWRRHEAAENHAATSDEALRQSLMRKRLIHGAVLLREILDDYARYESLQEAIDTKHADLKPRREALGALGADLAATLKDRSTALRERQSLLEADGRRARAGAQEAEKQRSANQQSAQAERQRVAEIDVALVHAQEFRATLEEAQVLDPGESAQAASRRHAEVAQTTGEQAHKLRAQAELKEARSRECRDQKSDLNAECTGLERDIRTLRESVREGEEKRRELAFDSTILALIGERQIDPDTDAIGRVLADARSKSVAKVRERERRQDMLEADRASLEATGLASIDDDVRIVSNRLNASGVPDAQPYAAYLSDIVRRPDDIRRFAELDPARFCGVAVPNRNALEVAQRVLQSSPALRRPVVVAVADDTPGETHGDRFVLCVDEPAAYDRQAARDLQERLDRELAGIEGSIGEEQRRIDRLESTLQNLDSWRTRFGDGKLDVLSREIEEKLARAEGIEGEMAALAERIESDETAARDSRARAREHDERAHVFSEYARRAREYHAQWESRLDDWNMARLGHEQTARTAEAQASDNEAERDKLTDEARRCEVDAADEAQSAAGMEREAGDIIYTAPEGQIAEDLDALRRDYMQDLETLRSLEEKSVDRLRGQQEEIRRAMARKEDHFNREFRDIARADVEAEAARDGIREAAVAADTAFETAQANAFGARAECEVAEKAYKSERDQRTEEIRPEPLADLQALTPEQLATIAPQAEQSILEQQTLAARETQAARQAREEAARNRRTEHAFAGWSSTLASILRGEIFPSERIDLPSEEEISALVSRTISDHSQARGMLNEAERRVFKIYDDIRRFTNSDAFRGLEGEREVAAHLSANDPLAAASDASRTAALIDERLKSIEHDLSCLDGDLQACIEELERLLSTALYIVRRMLRDGRIPAHVPRFGDQPVFRMSADLSRIVPTQRTEILRNYVTDLAEADRIPQTGQDIAAELVGRMTGALGRSTLGIRLLKPKGEGDTEHMPIDQVTVSGGELLTAAMMIYLVIARLRAEGTHGSGGETGVLIMDNPLGKANKSLLLKTQIGLADAMGIQLFYTTGVQDLSALAEFENIVRLRRNRQSRSTRRIHVEVEAMRTHIDRSTSDGAGRSTASVA